MTEPLLFSRSLGHLVPVDDRAKEALSKVKHGEVLTVEWKRPRNGKALRLYWALINLVFANLSEPLTYRTPEELSDAIKVSLGQFDLVKMPNGSTFSRPHSISFAKMKEDEFGRYLTAVIDLVVTKFLPGVTDRELRGELEEICGLRHVA